MTGAKRSLGQNFLSSKEAIEKIAEEVPLSTELLLEIGPGKGALTKALLSRAKKFFVLEKDTVLAKKLKHSLGEKKGLWIEEGDALTFDYDRIFTETNSPSSSLLVLSNLPYNVATEILFRLLEYRDKISKMVLMFQREVAERIKASPGSRKCGAISVFCQNFFTTKLLLHLKPEDFDPRPKVNSSVLVFEKREKPILELSGEEHEKFSAFVQMGFSHRRKTLENVLKLRIHSLGDFHAIKEPGLILREAGIDPSRRAESLSIADWGELFRVYRLFVTRGLHG